MGLKNMVAIVNSCAGSMTMSFGGNDNLYGKYSVYWYYCDK